MPASLPAFVKSVQAGEWTGLQRLTRSFGAGGRCEPGGPISGKLHGQRLAVVMPKENEKKTFKWINGKR